MVIQLWSYKNCIRILTSPYKSGVQVIPLHFPKRWGGYAPGQSPGRKEPAYGNNQIKGSTSSTFASRYHCRRAAVSVEHWLLLDRTSKNAASGEQGWRHRDLQCRCVLFP